MEQHQIIEQVTDWMQSQNRSSYLISKEEEGDLDQVALELSQISLGKLEVPDPDGYLAPQTLLLHGKGTVLNGPSQGPLPQDVFEIPLFGTWVTQDKGDHFLIQTERGVYTIQPH